MRTLCLGEVLVDLVRDASGAFVPHFGGDVANAAVTAARHGGEVALAAGAGDDAWGAWLRERLTAEGVALDGFELLAGVQTKIAFVRIAGGGEPSFMFYGDSVAPTRLPAYGALFFTSNTLLSEQERMLALTARRQALDDAKPVVVDANLRPERWSAVDAAVATVRGCVPDSALLKCNRSEAELLTGSRDPAMAADALLALGARAVVVTLGGEGALLRGAGGSHDVPGVAASPVDTTGAGDAVSGVLLARLGAAAFDPAVLPAALTEAVAVAAHVTEHFGAIA